MFLTREFKHDETNRAWWTGKWYGRGLGNSAMSQPAREFIVKIVEMSLWGSDFLLGHFLLIILTPPVLIPYANTLHSTMLCKSLFTFITESITELLFIISLAPSLEADPRTIVFNETEAPATMDRCEVHRSLHIYGCFTCIIDCPAYVLSLTDISPITNHALSAALFRDRITFDCAICRNI